MPGDETFLSGLPAREESFILICCDNGNLANDTFICCKSWHYSGTLLFSDALLCMLLCKLSEDGTNLILLPLGEGALRVLSKLRSILRLLRWDWQWLALVRTLLEVSLRALKFSSLLSCLPGIDFADFGV